MPRSQPKQVDPAYPAARTLPAEPAALGAVRGALERTAASPLAFPIAVGILSRLYSSALLILAEVLHGPQTVLVDQHSTFLWWDSQWYVWIASFGYHPYVVQTGGVAGHHDFAFYPAWPAVMRALETVGLPLGPASVIAANSLFVAALAVIYGFLVERFGPRAARGGVLLLAFSPAAFVLSMAYSEPMFLLLAGLYFASQGKRGQPLIAAASMLVRITGLAIMASAAVRWLRDRREPTPLLAAIAVLTTFAGWWVFIWRLTGDPLGWMQGSAAWSEYLGLTGIGNALDHLTLAGAGRLAVVGLMLAGGVLLLRRDLELGVYSLATIGMTLVGAPLESMPRHTLVAFPVFALLADRLGRRGTVGLLIAFGLLQLWFVGLTFMGRAPVPP